MNSFWMDFLVCTHREKSTPIYEIFRFADNSSANALLQLVLSGEKTATSSLLWEYEAEGRRIPQPGDLSIVTDRRGIPRCIIETIEVCVKPFDEVDEEFAADEGEGNLSLNYWRESHRRYFGRICQKLNREISVRMPVVCERFRMVYPLSQTKQIDKEGKNKQL